MTVLCVIPGPTHIVSTRDDDKPRWCFRCRHRHLHTWTLLDYEEPSYYDPIAVLRCPCCGGDYTRFPGT